MGKRVLLISARFYPSNRAASHRASQFGKYLPRYGWTPAALAWDWTRDNCGEEYDPGLAAKGDVCETVRIPYDGSTGLRYPLLRQLLAYRSPLSTYRGMLTAAEALHARSPRDVIWSTFAPGMDLRVADVMSRRHGIPWVADFRDLPDHFETGWVVRRKVRLEMKLCASAAALVAVSQALADRLASRHRAPVFVIPNGFDPEDFPPTPVHQNGRFTICYFGVVYYEPAIGRDPRPLFAALDLLSTRHDVDLNDFEVRFYGSEPGLIASLAKGYACQRLIDSPKRVPHAEVIQLMQNSVALLHLSSRDTKGVQTSKLPNYLGAGRPILSVPGDGDVVEETLRQTNAGRAVGDPADIAATLLEWYREWKATGTVAYHGNHDAIMKYSRERQAGQLAEILNAIIAHL